MLQQINRLLFVRQGGQEIKCQVTIEGGVWPEFSVLTEYLDSNYDFEKRETADSKSILEDIERKIGQSNTLDVSSHEDLMEVDQDAELDGEI